MVKSAQTREEREKRLKIIRDNKASRRALETTEQRVSNVPVKLDRKESAVCGLCENWPQRNVLPKAARKKELRLRARRERAATARTGRKQSRLAEETKHERRPTIGDGTSERLSLKHTAANICTTADGQTLKIAVCITKSGPRRRWQPSIASRKTCATIIVSFAKKHGRCLLPDSRYFLAPDASETESRVDYILLRTTWVLEASQLNYKASVKSRNC